MTRVTDPYMPLKGKQDRQYPSTEQISYDNYLVGFREREINYECNFVFSESGASQFPEKNHKLTENKIEQADSQIKKIIIYYFNSSVMTGLRLYDKDNN